MRRAIGQGEAGSGRGVQIPVVAVATSFSAGADRCVRRTWCANSPRGPAPVRSVW